LKDIAQNAVFVFEGNVHFNFACEKPVSDN